MKKAKKICVVDISSVKELYIKYTHHEWPMVRHTAIRLAGQRLTTQYEELLLNPREGLL